MKPLIENMNAAHLEQVAALERQCFTMPWPLRSFQEEMSNTLARYYVMLMGDEVIAYGGFWHVLSEAHITNIAVRPEYQGMGYGSMLLAHMINQAHGMGIGWMTLEVRASNTAAKKLYSKHGFSEAGRRPRYYADNCEDAVIMTKEW